MKNFNVICYNTGVESNATDKKDKQLIEILTDLGDSIDPQGCSKTEEYNIAIDKIKKLYNIK